MLQKITVIKIMKESIVIRFLYAKNKISETSI